jgi:hypothetical protein
MMMASAWCWGAAMRTTIRIEDTLYRRAKSRAAAGGRSVGEFIEDAVRDALERRPAPSTKLLDLLSMEEKR